MFSRKFRKFAYLSISTESKQMSEIKSFPRRLNTCCPSLFQAWNPNFKFPDLPMAMQTCVTIYSYFLLHLSCIKLTCPTSPVRSAHHSASRHFPSQLPEPLVEDNHSPEEPPGPPDAAYQDLEKAQSCTTCIQIATTLSWFSIYHSLFSIAIFYFIHLVIIFLKTKI